MLSADRARLWLTWLLRFIGGVMLLATLAVFLPTDAMAAIHRRIGLGELPRAAITEYLARSLSALYALHGAVLLLLASDVARYRTLIAAVGLLHVAFGGVTLWIDLAAGMPSWWTLNEGGPVALAGGVIYLLARRVSPQS